VLKDFSGTAGQNGQITYMLSRGNKIELTGV